MIKNFIDLESQEYQDLYKYYHDLPSSLSSQERINLLEQWLLSNYQFPSNTLTTLATYFVSMFEQQSISTSTPPSVPTGTLEDSLFLSVYDIEYLTSSIRSNIDQVPESLFRLAVSYAVFSRANPHPNNWIKCDAKDKDIIMFLASCSKLSSLEKNNLTNALHSLYNLNMRVIGSNSPVPCFQFPWQLDQPHLVDTIHNPSAILLNDSSSDNFLVAIGPQDPSTITKFVDSIISTSDDSTNIN